MLRNKRGWSAHRLAQNAGVADPYLRKVESGGGAGVGIGILARIAHALDVTLADVLREAGMLDSVATSQLMAVYEALDVPHRRFLDRIGHELRELQDEYRGGGDNEAEGGPPAAPPGTPPAGDTGWTQPPPAEGPPPDLTGDERDDNEPFPGEPWAAHPETIDTLPPPDADVD